MIELMVAQAQEMVVLKAIMDNMKDQIVAKLCASCEDMVSQLRPKSFSSKMRVTILIVCHNNAQHAKRQPSRHVG